MACCGLPHGCAAGATRVWPECEAVSRGAKGGCPDVRFTPVTVLRCPLLWCVGRCRACQANCIEHQQLPVSWATGYVGQLGYGI